MGCVNKSCRILSVEEFEKRFLMQRKYWGQQPKRPPKMAFQSRRGGVQGTVAILGGPSVGKCSLEAAFVNGVFYDDTSQLKEPMLGHPYRKQFTFNDEYMLMTFDYPPLARLLYNATARVTCHVDFASLEHVFVVVFDLTRKSTLDDARYFLNWICDARGIRRVDQQLAHFPPAVLVGNKRDLKPLHEERMSGVNLAQVYGIPYIEVSSKDDKDFSNVFGTASQLLYQEQRRIIDSKGGGGGGNHADGKKCCLQ